MKKNIMLILQLGLLLPCLPAMAQHEEPLLASVAYQFIHVNDTNNRANPVKAEMILRLGQSNSKYNNASLENRLKNAQAKSKAQISAPAAPRKMIAGGPMAVVMNESFDVLFQIPTENKLIKTATLGMQDYLIETGLPKIDWKIENEIKTIGTYSCQKATGFFAGRIYTAWFTADLPFRNGPWKLWGLPGLILEATDSKNEVLFLFKEIFKGTDNERISSTARRPVKVGEEAYARAKKAFDQNPSGTMQAQLGNNGFDIGTFYMDASGNTIGGDEAKAAIKREATLKNQNPIELTKN